MSDERIAAVYAGALFAAARDQDAVQSVRDELFGFAGAYQDSPELRGVLLDPQVRQADKDRALRTLSEGAHPLVTNTLRVLLAKGRISLLPEVARELGHLAERAAEVVEVEVTSAVVLADAAEQELARRLEETMGHHVRLVKRVDPGIIGGLSLRITDELLVDASVKARVGRLRERVTGVTTRGASE